MGTSEIRDRALAAYMGLAVGDALGATTEFMLPSEIRAAYGLHRHIIGGGWLRLRPGKVTDDTTISLALGDALIKVRGMDAKTVADAFVDWMRSKPPDIGSTVRSGLRRYILDGSLEAPMSDQAAGNGAAMRNIPVIMATLSDYDLFRQWTLSQCHITHNNKLSDAGALLLGELTRLAILHGQSARLHSRAAEWIKAFSVFDYSRYRGETDGYIVNTVKTVLHFFFNTGDFESCLIGVVNQGGDADTNGALAGQIAGAFYGLDSIPHRWLGKIDPVVRGRIEQQSPQLVSINYTSSTSDR